MFIGEYEHKADEKGRLAIPAKFRASLGDRAVITRGLDRCLFLFSGANWEELAKKLANLPMADANSRAFGRLMLAGAMEAPIDAQGRILLPDYLRTYAGIGKQAIVAGLYSRIEIWNDEAWKKYKSETESQSNEIAARLSELGI
jgi:MraZ protein